MQYRYPAHGKKYCKNHLFQRTKTAQYSSENMQMVQILSGKIKNPG